MVRGGSAIVMIAVAGTALWVGGPVIVALVAIVGTIAFYEWIGLTWRIVRGAGGRLTLAIVGVIYIGTACAALIMLRGVGLVAATLPIVATIATDVGAYFTGRAVGGPKIAPSISPSKTWSGLLGGMMASSAAVAFVMSWSSEAATRPGRSVAHALLLGAALAIVAQAGDFAESFMKRRAGVKDSGTLIPGHGGVLDRVDGLLAVMIVFAAICLVAALSGTWR